MLADPLFFTENKSKLHPPQSAQPLIKVFQPWPYENISSVNFIASVTVVTVTEKPTIFELVTDSGVVIGSKPGVSVLDGQTVDLYGTNIVLESIPIFLAP